MNKIPKKIHYCWFGKGIMPELEKKCIQSWKLKCPDYELIKWDEKNFDITCNQYVKEAYENKKYAFVTDFVRLYALYNYGGIYMDTDVEVIKELDSFLNNSAFLGFETKHQVGTAIMASEKGNKLFSDLLQYYEKKKFIDENGEFDITTNVKIITEILNNKGLVKENGGISDSLKIYETDYFCPKDYNTGKIILTKNTCAIHHFNGSWHTKEKKLIRNLYRIFGKKLGLVLYCLIILVWQPIKTSKKILKKVNNRGK